MKLRFGLPFGLAAALAVAFLTVNNQPAFAQYAPAENPAKRHAQDGKKVKDLEDRIQKLEQQAAKPPTPPPAPPKPTGMTKQQIWLLIGVIVLGLAAGFALWFFKLRKPSEDEDEPEHTDLPAREPGQHGFGLIGMMLIIAVLAMFLFPLFAHAAGCYVTKVGGVTGDSRMPVLVEGQPNTVFCPTDAQGLQVFNGSHMVPITGLTRVTSPAPGFTFTIRPTAAAELRVVAPGNVTVGRLSLFVTDAYGAWNAHIAVESVRPEIEAMKGVQVDQWTKVFGPNGLSQHVDSLETRLTTLENRPAPEAPKLDMSAYNAELDKLRAQVDEAKAAAAAAVTRAQNAEAKVDKLATARVKTGIFRSKTLQEAADDTKQ